ncbi:MAG: hypothetical protein A3K19_22995 [Lentisphaerae bacterium RIFOXYB12_FULL_65_16]|nr:MAG: hypothetical protein A3K18_16760 [Lentisphaerae bacterium RIFOXYA12_64_32]OGV90077.1 MAG: hypothetical protein A3K19_22995 [Lentisphaerae bacterium RIFOXYB12_FULL_65_16]
MADIRAAGDNRDPVFPLWDIVESRPPRMSMADYLAFVDFCWEHTTDKARVRQERDRLVPTVQFRV